MFFEYRNICCGVGRNQKWWMRLVVRFLVFFAPFLWGQKKNNNRVVSSVIFRVRRLCLPHRSFSSRSFRHSSSRLFVSLSRLVIRVVFFVCSRRSRCSCCCFRHLVFVVLSFLFFFLFSRLVLLVSCPFVSWYLFSFFSLIRLALSSRMSCCFVLFVLRAVFVCSLITQEGAITWYLIAFNRSARMSVWDAL